MIFGAMGGNKAVVLVHDFFRDSQPDPRSLVSIDVVEPLENDKYAVKELLVETNAIVGDDNPAIGAFV